jgi:hypothetical protein
MAIRVAVDGHPRPSRLSDRPAPRDAVSMKKKSPTALPDLKPDPKLTAAWKSVAKKLDALSSREATDFDALWETVAKVVEHEPPLYVAGGYKTAKDFFERHLHVDQRTATRNLRVARYASPDDEATYGATNIDAALGYLEAVHGKLGEKLPVAFARLTIPVADGKRGTKRAPFPSLSAQQIASATRAVLARKSPAPKDPARAALETSLAKHPAFSRVVVHQRAGFATFANVPLASLALFARALTATRLPPVKAVAAVREQAKAKKRGKKRV